MQNVKCIYHRVMKRENFEKAANDIYDLFVEAQKKYPDSPRVLYLDIDSHRNSENGFDKDMMELQKDFCLGFLLQFFEEINLPLGKFKNCNSQNNNIPERLEIVNRVDECEGSLERLYIENYSNTEFFAEDSVYLYMSELSDFLRKYLKIDVFDSNRWRQCKNVDFLKMWHEYLKDLMVELYNSFLHGNLIIATAMTRNLIECYAYLKIIEQNLNTNILQDWYICGIIRKQKEMKDNTAYKENITDAIKSICQLYERDYDEDILKYKRENDWLCDYLDLKRVSFKDICDYSKIANLYADYQKTCSFIHGQDITSKIGPFTFYNSIYFKVYIMSEYMFKMIKIFTDDAYVISQINKLYSMLVDMKKEFMQ